jgi:thiol:disulfide interchange protein DsbD
MKFFAKRVAALLLAILPPVLFTPAFAAEDLLDPDVAFRFSAKMVDPATVQVSYQIADGYYMYRDRFRFVAVQEPVKFGAAHLPAGGIKEDDFYGKVETYRGSVTIELPIESAVPAGGFTLKVVSQGCADAGVCYTPLTQVANLVPAAYSEAGPPGSSKVSGLLARLQGRAANSAGEEEFLPVEKAFIVEVRSADAHTLVARLSPAESYYLYRDKIHFTIAQGEKVAIDSVRLPRGEIKQDPNFGKTEVFHTPVQAVIRLRRDSAEKIPAVLTVGFQGCSERGLCYSPATRQIPIVLAALSTPDSPAKSSAGALNPAPAAASIQQPSEDRQIAGLLKTGSFWLVMVSFLGFGLLLSFTPCVLPMIPILSGMIAGQGHKVTRLRGFTLSALYVMGMAIAYAIAGVLAGLSGTLLSAALQTPWVLGAFAGVFVLLALSMFGFYELQLPGAWQTGAASTSNRLTGGTVAGVFAMGAISAVIVGPCVAAPLAGALLYVSQSHDVLLGGAALFTMGLGMGLPLIVIGASAGSLLPKAGAWMQSVKNFFGVLLLGAAIWMISPLIPITAQMLCWAVLLIMSAIYLHAIDPLPAGASGLRKLWKGFGIIALLLGAAFLIGGLSGGRDLFQPLSGLQMRTGVQKPQETSFIRVASIAELERAVASAGKPVMLDFYADWCVACKEMERLTFRDESVKKRLDAMLLLQADVTANSAADMALLKRFGLFGPPGIIFFDRRGKEIEGARVIGYRPVERFLPTLDEVDNFR